MKEVVSFICIIVANAMSVRDNHNLTNFSRKRDIVVLFFSVEGIVLFDCLLYKQDYKVSFMVIHPNYFIYDFFIVRFYD